MALTLPVWHQNQAGIATARFTLEAVRKAYEDTRERALAQIRAAAARVEGNRRLVRLFEEEIIPITKRNVETAMASYKAGRRDIMVLVHTQEEGVSQGRAWTQILETLAQSLADLEEAVGGDLKGLARAAEETGEKDMDMENEAGEGETGR